MNDFLVPNEFWELPTCPQLAHHILKLVPLDKESIPELLDLLRWDPAITARILVAANGTKFGQSWPVVSLNRARLLLDDLILRLLSLQFTLDSLSPEKENDRPLYEALWRQSHIHAVTALLLCEEGTEQSEVNPFLAGLLLGLPRLALLQSRPELSRRIFENLIQTARTWNAVERELNPAGNDHSNTPSLFQAHFPMVFVKAVKSHAATFPNAADATSQFAKVFAVAEAMGDFLLFEQRNPALSQHWLDRLIHQYGHYRNETPGQGSHAPIQSLIDTVRQRLEEISPSPEELSTEARMLSRANRELGRLGFQTSMAHGQAQTRAQQAEQSLQQFERKIFNLERQALRDALTGVYNRRFLLEALQKEVARSCRHATPIGLLFLDVDAFKPLNDTWGHLVGDIVLRRIAETLTEVLRHADILARYGGEEFVILPNDPTETGVVQLGERLRVAVEQLVIKVEGERLPVTVSVGCTLTVPARNDLDLGPQLLASADAAMYDAKQLGRNRVVFRSMLEESERDLMQHTIECSFSRWLVVRNILSSQVLESLLLDYSPERLPLGELAIDTGVLTDQQVAEILKLQLENGGRFGALALQENMLNEEQLAMLLARQRENPIQLAQLLIGKSLLEESQALELVNEYLAGLK